MNLAQMRTKFKAHTSGLADSSADSAIDEYLNLFHRWIIPADVTGSIGEYVWEWTYQAPHVVGLITIGLPYLDIPDAIVALPKPKSWINDPSSSNNPIRLDVSFDFTEFAFDWPSFADTSQQGRPDAMCIFGDKLYFNRIADQDYTGSTIVRSGPAALDSFGIGDDILANQVITGSAWVYLLEKEDTMGAAREGGLYDIYKQLMLTRSGSRFQPRRDTRSF
jgi:hypothetical protein